MRFSFYILCSSLPLLFAACSKTNRMSSRYDLNLSSPIEDTLRVKLEKQSKPKVDELKEQSTALSAVVELIEAESDTTSNSNNNDSSNYRPGESNPATEAIEAQHQILLDEHKRISEELSEIKSFQKSIDDFVNPENLNSLYSKIVKSCKDDFLISHPNLKEKDLMPYQAVLLEKANEMFVDSVNTFLESLDIDLQLFKAYYRSRYSVMTSRKVLDANNRLSKYINTMISGMLFETGESSLIESLQQQLIKDFRHYMSKLKKEANEIFASHEYKSLNRLDSIGSTKLVLEMNILGFADPQGFASDSSTWKVKNLSLSEDRARHVHQLLSQIFIQEMDAWFVPKGVRIIPYTNVEGRGNDYPPRVEHSNDRDNPKRRLAHVSCVFYIDLSRE
jgi:hypothetical protein